jgi:hypothetical protein
VETTIVIPDWLKEDEPEIPKKKGNIRTHVEDPEITQYYPPEVTSPAATGDRNKTREELRKYETSVHDALLFLGVHKAHLERLKMIGKIGLLAELKQVIDVLESATKKEDKK